MLTWQEARRYHPNQKGIHQRQGQILSICASFIEEKQKYPDQLLSEDLMIYIGEGGLTQPQPHSPGNLALKRAKENGAIFPVIAKWGKNQYEYLGKWQVIDWEYSPLQGLPAHYRFLLKRVESPETEAKMAKEIILAKNLFNLEELLPLQNAFFAIQKLFKNLRFYMIIPVRSAITL